MKYTCVRRLQFCAGHRVYKHESKCANIHGHNYVLYIHARPIKGLDPIGRVIDFSVLKKWMGDWIDEHWDHGFIYYNNDPELKKLFAIYQGNVPVYGALYEHKNYVLYSNPTAENMAAHLLNDICPDLFHDTQIEVYKIVLWETENCFVEVEL